MKNKRILHIFILVIISFVLSTYFTTSFASNSDITTYSPHCLIMETSTRESYL